MSVEVLTDSRPIPADFPSDASIVLRWNEDDPPPERWELAAIVTGAKDADEACREAVRALPELSAQTLLADKLTTKSYATGRFRRRESTSISVEAMK